MAAPTGGSVGGNYGRIHTLRWRHLPRSYPPIAPTTTPAGDPAATVARVDLAASPAGESGGGDGSAHGGSSGSGNLHIPNERWRRAEFSSVVSDYTFFDLVFDECLIL
uniref:Uncharacterized protein n=1 Tax=Oryza punctata TaxID=4537 RepID=A0A0E0M5C0_ORYPU